MATNTKPGWKTSEFWFMIVFTVIQIAAMAVGLIPDPKISIIVGGVLTGIYLLARTIAKIFDYEAPEIEIPGGSKKE